jgi:hypothetical protein
VGLCAEKVTNSSGAPGHHDGPEGTSPGGKPTCVGSDRESGVSRQRRNGVRHCFDAAPADLVDTDPTHLGLVSATHLAHVASQGRQLG